ncbi:MAG: hypothetical protein ACTHU0_19230 [Kofleriaceae bacterium]
MPKQTRSKSAPKPVRRNDVFAAFVEGAASLTAELTAWRQFGIDVKAWLESKGLSEEFGQWQDAKGTQPA